MAKTKIEWCDYTINPVKGLCPMACPYCYARRMYKRFKWDETIRFWQLAFNEMPVGPCKVFVGSTMELFGDWVKPEWLSVIFEYIRRMPHHTFIFLTKQPQNLIKWSPLPDNCWVGVSATNDLIASAGCAWLSQVKAKVKFISLEPFLSLENPNNGRIYWQQNYHDINWVIMGQQTPTSQKTSPEWHWIKGIINACNDANIPYFLKNNLESVVPKMSYADGQLIQNFPRLEAKP